MTNTNCERAHSTSTANNQATGAPIATTFTAAIGDRIFQTTTASTIKRATTASAPKSTTGPIRTWPPEK